MTNSNSRTVEFFRRDDCKFATYPILSATTRVQSTTVVHCAPTLATVLYCTCLQRFRKSRPSASGLGGALRFALKRFFDRKDRKENSARTRFNTKLKWTIFRL